MAPHGPENPRRRLLLQTIRAHPGATFRELVRSTGLAGGTARHHLTVLRRQGHIVERRHRSTLRFFVAGTHNDDWEAVVLLRQAGLARLHGWLQEHPGVIQKDALEVAAEWGWSRSTTQHRLQRLVDAGLLEAVPQGRRKMYRVPQEEAPRPLLERMRRAMPVGVA